MMTQTVALFVDAYRELHAKKMFWIVMALNVLVVAAFAIIGVNDHTITILWFEPLGNMNMDAPPIFLYKTIFSNVVVGFWLTWLAALLALVSTAGIFPDFLASGSIDLFLAKPIGRLRLFFTKYVAGLLFVTLQVAVFSLGSFLVLGWRAGLWEAGLFLAIPIVVVFFSYLYAIMVLLGVVTRSTIAALLLVLVAWFGLWAVDRTEAILATVRDSAELRQADVEDRLAALDKQAADATAQTGPASQPVDSLQYQREQLLQERDQAAISPTLVTIDRLAFAIKTIVPKTKDTTNLLDRVLFKDKELQDMIKQQETPAAAGGRAAPAAGPFRRGRLGPRAQARQTQQLERERQRSIFWVIGTSLVFEAVVLTLAAWHFCTRDF